MKIYNFCIMALLAFSLIACGKGKTAKEKIMQVSSYWDSFDFKDTALIDNPGITEPKFVQFCKIIEKMSPEERTMEVDSFLSRSKRGSEGMFWGMIDLAEKYLADPNSPCRNEESFISFLEYIDRAKDIDSLHKERPRFLLHQAKMNRLGTKATDFAYITRNGKKGTLGSVKTRYTLLYFNNPDCHDCARVMGYLEASNVYTEMVKKHSLTILAVYPDEIMTSWDKHKSEYPATWIVARCEDIKSKELYSLPAIPSLYLLDRNKKVLVKDGTVEDIEDYLRNVNKR